MASITQLLIDSVIDYAIFVLDPRGHVLTWNRGAERLKGYRADEIIGRHFSTFYTAEDRDSGLPTTLLEQAEADGSVTHSGWRVRRDGKRFWGDVTITALRSDGVLVGFAKVTRDLTDRHDLEEGLRQAVVREHEAARELEELHRTRTRLVATIIHDLTTPITVVRGGLELALEEPGLGEELRLLLADARRNAEDLEQLRVQLQEFARLEGGALALQLAPVGLAELTRQLTHDLGRVLRGAEVVTEVQPHLRVLADELALRRILTNLATNAARYSPPDAPIRIVTAPAEVPGRVAVGVVDQGPGISAEDQRRVFREFWSGRSGTRPEGGLGLGLRIVKGYAEEHGGEVWIESTEGGGTTFWFTLQLASAPAGATTVP